MDHSEPRSRLEHLSTHWSVVVQAHVNDPGLSQAAQTALIERYGEAIYRLFVRLVRSSAHAEELCQEFALRLARGDFRKAAAVKGRFRDLLKTVVTRMAMDHFRRLKRQRAVSLRESVELIEFQTPDLEREFVEVWRQYLIDRAWQVISDRERQSGSLIHSLLRLRVDHPSWSAEELAAAMQERSGRIFSADALRQALHRSREAFAEALMDDVSASLADPTYDALQQELAELDLLHYCKPWLLRREASRQLRQGSGGDLRGSMDVK